MGSILLPGMLMLACFCSVDCFARMQAINDTTILYKKDTLFKVDNAAAIVPVIFTKNARELYDTNQVVLLMLGNPTVIEKAEGVYELYLTEQRAGINQHSSASKHFVTVLDLYSITAPGADKQIKIDISLPLKNIMLHREAPLLLYVVIKFGGIEFPNEKKSAKAGRLIFNSVLLAQVNGKRQT